MIVALEIANGHQHFLIGHTDSVVALAFNDCRHKNGKNIYSNILSQENRNILNTFLIASSTSILASAQKGEGGIVRVWRFDNKKCAAIVKSQQASTMAILAFSTSGGVLIGCGK